MNGGSTWANRFTVTEEFLSSNTYRHAITQFDITYPLPAEVDKDSEGYEMQQSILQNVMELLDVFYQQGHSGFSSSYALGIFKRLVMFEPILTPTTKGE